MKIINGWIFCNRILNNGMIASCAIQLDNIIEIVEYSDGNATFIVDYEGHMIETNTNIIDALAVLQKYLTGFGTNKQYNPNIKEPKYEVTYGFGDNLTVDSYTEEEFKHFINIAVCNNKDVKNFSVNIIIPD